MMEDPGHMIKSHLYQVNLEDEKGAHDIQSRISVLQESRIKDLIASICDTYQDPKSIYQFSSVELDLGVIPKADFDNELVTRIENKLHEFFQAAIRENGELRTGKRIFLHDQKLDQFIHFLQYGYLNRESNYAGSPAQLLRDLIRENPNALRDQLMQYGRQEYVRKRLIHQFEEEPLEQIVTLVVPEQAKYIISYKRSMLSQQEKKKPIDTSPSSFRSAVWEIILAYLFLDSKSYYTRKNFLQFLIQKIAVKYNLTYQVLLNIMSETLKQDKQYKVDQEFKKLVVELDEEESSRQLQSGIENSLLNMDRFLKKGTFTASWHPQSPQDFNQQFFYLLSSKPQGLGDMINEWLRNKTSRFRLLRWIDKRSIQKLLVQYRIPYFIDGMNLFQVLDQHRSVFDPGFIPIWNDVLVLKERLILKSYPGRSHSPAHNIYLLLVEIRLQSVLSDQLFLKFLQDIEPKVQSKYKKGIALFMNRNGKIFKQSKQALKGKKLHQVLDEVLSFTQINEKETWLNFFEQHFKQWTEKTGKSRTEILAFIEAQLQVEYNAAQLLEFIRQPAFQSKVNSGSNIPKFNKENKPWSQFNPSVIRQMVNDLSGLSNPASSFYRWMENALQLIQRVHKQYEYDLDELVNYLIHATSKRYEYHALHVLLQRMKSSDQFQEIAKAEQNKNKRNQQIELVLFVLLKGKLPWWQVSYNLKQLNLDFAQLWKQKSFRVEILSLLASNRLSKDLSSLLTASNQQLILRDRHELPMLKPQKSFEGQSLFELILNWIESDLIPIGVISSRQLQELKKQIFDSISSGSDKSSSDEFLKFLLSLFPVQKGSSEVYQFELLNILEKSNTNDKQDVHSLILNWKSKLEEQIEHKELLFNIPASLDEYIVSHFKTSASRIAIGGSIADNLQHILVDDPEQFQLWLNIPQFRNKLVFKVAIKDQINLITTAIPSDQIQLFRSSLKILEHLKMLASNQVTTIQKRFFELIWLKYAIGTANQWNLSAWVEILHQAVVEVLGKSKALAAVVHIQETQTTSPTAVPQMELNMIQDLKERITHNALEKSLQTFPTASSNKEGDADVDHDKSYKKLGEEEPHELLNPIFIQNGGLILVAPFLGMLFEKCSLFQGGKFKDEVSQQKAIKLLQYAATGNPDDDEPGQVINKVLCGLPISIPVNHSIELSSEEMETVDGLLHAITQQWTPLKGTSIEGLRTSFLQREARIEEEEESFYMIVEQKSYDMLLDQIPWNITQIKLSWMPKMLMVEWRP